MALNKRKFNNPDNILAARIQSAIKNINTATLVQVVGVDSVNKKINAFPLVQMMDLNNNVIDQSQLNNIPYARLQGGNYGIICDPKVNDIGIVVFCSRDISNVIKNKTKSLPGSKRNYSISDGVYIASLLLNDPSIYIKIDDKGVEIQGNLKVTGNITATGDVKAGDISLQSHIHGNGNKGDNTTNPLSG